MSTLSSPPPSAADGYHLRPVGPADAAAVLAAFRSAEDMDRQGTVTDLDEARAQIDWLLAAERHAIAIAAPAPQPAPAEPAPPGDPAPHGPLVGLVAISADRRNRTGWFFYWLHAAHRGRGLASRAAIAVAARALAPEADGGWGLERLELGHRANNPASGAVARAVGFVQEGTEREKFLLGAERVDVLTYGRLRSDPAPAGPGLPWGP